MKADDIRRRHGDLLQKIKSLRMATSDRKMQLKEMLTMGKRNRPKTGFLRTPNHIAILKGMLTTDIASVRQVFTAKCEARFYTVTDRKKCDALIHDLEKQLREIDLDLENCVDEFKRRQQEADDSEAMGDALRAKTPRVVPSIGVASPAPTLEGSILPESILHNDAQSITLLSASTTPRSSVSRTEKQPLPPLAFGTRQLTQQADPPSPKPSTSGEAKVSSPIYRKYPSTSANSITSKYNTQLQRRKVVSMAADKQTENTNARQHFRLHRQRTDMPTKKPQTANNFRGQYILKPSVGYPFGSSFPDLPPLPARKWNGKRYVSVGSATAAEVPPSKARQVINVRQNTWLW